MTGDGRGRGHRRRINHFASNSRLNGWTARNGPARTNVCSPLVFLLPHNCTFNLVDLSRWPRRVPSRAQPQEVRHLVPTRTWRNSRKATIKTTVRPPMVNRKVRPLMQKPLQKRPDLKCRSRRGMSGWLPASTPVELLRSGRTWYPSVTASLNGDATKAFPAIAWWKPRCWALRASGSEDRTSPDIFFLLYFPCMT